MSKSINLRSNVCAFFENSLVATLLLFVFFTANCSAQQQPNEQQALQTLRQMTRDGKLPPEATVQQIETRYSQTQTGALAKLLRARIRFEENDFAGAAKILASN